MQININITLNIDECAWTDHHGFPPNNLPLSSAIEDWAQNLLVGSLADNNLLDVADYDDAVEVNSSDVVSLAADVLPPKKALHCTRGNAPTCPSCGNSNALLGETKEISLSTYVRYLTCRDCGYSIEELNTLIVCVSASGVITTGERR